MNTATRSAAHKALTAIAALTHIDLKQAIDARRHNPILEREINLEAELINLKESCDSFHVAGESLRHYPKMYAHVSRERRDIMRHCLGLVARMAHGYRVPRDYSLTDADAALKRLVALVVRECKRADKKMDMDTVEAFRPYLTVRDRVWLRDFGMDLVAQATQLQRALSLAHKLPLMRAK